MEEYREKNMPATTSATEHQDAVMDAWQTIVANFDAEISDGKETFGRKAAQQSVEEEYSIYVMGALSAGSTVDTLGFWKV
jgi:poly(A) polymerase Pap1